MNETTQILTPTEEANALLAKCSEVSALAEKIGPEALLAVCAALGRGARFSKTSRPEFGQWVATVAALTFGTCNASQILSAARHANNQADGEVFVMKASTSGGNTAVGAKLKTPAVVAVRME